MRKQALTLSLLVALCSTTISAENNRQNGKQETFTQYKKSQQKGQGKLKANSKTLSQLTVEQQEGLIFMIEEEKVARDVYITLYEKWGSSIFSNISQSEQKHMDAVYNLLKQYDLEVPQTLSAVGTFQDQHLQTMYDDLIAKGNTSLIDALEVGVMIEELDIADLKELIEAGVPSNVEQVYNNLLEGSYKHLNAFNRQLSRQ
jgi:hypothetical protein